MNWKLKLSNISHKLLGATSSECFSSYCVICFDVVTGDMSAVPNGHDEATGDADSAAVDDSTSHTNDVGQSKIDESDVAKAGDSSEVVVIQDTGFNISIVAPGVDPFDLPVYYRLLPCVM